MGPETPPRRSKSDQAPLTIDLEATRAATDAAEVSAADAQAATTADDAATGDIRQASAGTGADTPPPLDAASPSDNDRVDAAASAFAEEPARQQAPASRQPSNAGPLAAGILGGLIALLGAGGLQYAGVMPSLGPNAGDAALEQSVTSDIAAIKARLAAAPTTDPAPLEARLAALEQTAAQADSAASADVSGLQAQVENLTQELAALKSGLADAQASTETARTELSTRIEAAEKKIDEPASDVQLARAIAVTALKTAIDRGGPFLAELDALKSIAPEDPAVTGLAADAATGIMSRADMVGRFPDVADIMLESVRYTDPNQGVLGRLIDSAASAIRVRPVGTVDGEGPEAVIARIENKLTNGDLKGASLEWETLPQEAKAAGLDYKTKLDQRIRVEGLIEPAVAGAMSANQG